MSLIHLQLQMRIGNILEVISRVCMFSIPTPVQLSLHPVLADLIGRISNVPVLHRTIAVQPRSTRSPQSALLML